MRKKAEPHNKRQTNQLANVSEYTTDIRQIAGKDNVVADALSRAPVAHGPPLSPTLDVPNISSIDAIDTTEGIDYKELEREQRTDRDTLALRRAPNTGLHLVEVACNGTTALLCDESTGKLRPVVPLKLRRRVFDVIHGFLRWKTIYVPKFNPVGSVELTLSRKT